MSCTHSRPEAQRLDSTLSEAPPGNTWELMFCLDCKRTYHANVRPTGGRFYACRSCGHHHRSPEACGRNLAGGKSCRCVDPEGGYMAKGNGKDGFTEIEGKRPKGKSKTESLGLLPLHVIRAAVKETDVAGECVSQIVIAGSGVEKAHELLAMVGEEVMIGTAGGVRKLRAVLNSVTVKGDDNKLEVRAKATGGRDLDAIVGLAVQIEASQLRLGGAPRVRGSRGDEADA